MPGLGGKRSCYLEWKQQHSPHCQANFEGSAPAMEAEGASVMFAHSVARYKLRYRRMVCDGDSKSFHRISSEKPYGDIPVEKHDCIGHVAKRMGKRLRDLKKSWGNRKLEDGKSIGGRGRLTLAKIDNLQRYYGLAIRRNLLNIDKMKQEIMAGLYHTCRSHSFPEQHQFCPKGDASWCRWQRDQASGGEEYSDKNCLPACFLEILKPVYESLCKDDLLQRCSGGFTQNANESFNSVLWSRSLKHRYHGPRSVETAVASAVLQFNSGAHAALNVLQGMAIQSSSSAFAVASRRDRKRLSSASRKESSVAKRVRQSARLSRKRKDDDLQEQEGTTYAPGAF